MIEQLSLWGKILPPFKITKPIRLIELFAGIGSQAKALENIKANFTHYKVCEFEKHAIDSYNAIHNTNFQVSDITKLKASDLEIVDTDKYDYILTYSFPCQDLSVAGKMQGLKKGCNTRSGLLWEVERLIKELGEKRFPQILLMENVPEIISKKNIYDFQEWCLFLENKGYKNYCEILNAKNYGIPQNRKRCFMVSILGDYSYTFPKKIKLKKEFKDFLDKKVDKKYYLSEEELEKIKNWNAQQDPLKNIDKEKIICPTLTARGAGEKHSGMILINEKTMFNFKRKKIRTITPKECFRLMGFTDLDYEKARLVNNDFQLYKQAGNSIVVNVLEEIFKKLFEKEDD